MRSAGLLAAVCSAGVAYAGTRYAVGRRTSDRSRWTRLNHAGAPVTLGEGPAAVLGAVAGYALSLPELVGPDPTPGVSRVVRDHFRQGVGGTGTGAGPVLVALVGSGVVGLVDDLAEGEQAKGFRGHLGALRQGRLTTGMIKVGGVGLTALAAAALVAARRTGVGAVGRASDVVLDTALIAGTANLTNLLDLRPGRAGKVVGLAALALARRGGAPVLGAVLGALPEDLAGRAMLGDCGANGLGAGVATVAVQRLPRGVRLLLLAGVVGLNAASERVSFSAVIDRTPWLRRLDRLGRPGERA